MSKPHLVEVRNVIFMVGFMNSGISLSLCLHDIEHGLGRTLHSPHRNDQDHMW